MSPGVTRVDGCDLCRAARITPWYYEDEICWIAECEICEVPMVVWRYHGTTPPDQHVAHMRERLTEVAAKQFGEFWVDRSEEHTSELQSQSNLVCRLLLEKKKHT